MEHNFNPNKGDYKYILESERRKETGEAQAPPVSTKQKMLQRLWARIIDHIQKRPKQRNTLQS